MFEPLERRALFAATPLGDWGVTYRVMGTTLLIEGTAVSEQINVDDDASGDLLLYATDGTHVGQATVSGSGVTRIIVRLFGGDDVLDATTLDITTRDVHAWGGDGGDVMWGGIGDDHLHGGDGDDALSGGPGDDKLFGGSGENALDGGGGKDVLVP